MIPLRITCDVLEKFCTNSSTGQYLPWIFATSHEYRAHVYGKPQEWMSSPCQCCKKTISAVKMLTGSEFVTLTSTDRAYNQIKNFSFSKVHQQFGKRKRSSWAANIAGLVASRRLSGRRSQRPLLTTL